MKTKLLFTAILLFSLFTVKGQCPTNTSAAISSLPYSQAVSDITTSGNDFGSGDACGGTWMTGEDYTYTYTPAVDECIDILVNAGAYYGLFITDGCPNSSAANCIDQDYIYGAGTLSISDLALVAGTTYYITVSYWPPSSSSFDILITSHVCHTPPTTGNCTDMTINTTMYSQSGLTTCGFGDDFDNTDACGNFYMNGDDIVIEYIPTTTECVTIALTNTGTYTGLFVMDGCAFDSGVNCLASNTNSGGSPSIQLFNVTAGTSYFIHVSTNANPQCTSFDLDISSCPPISPCGNVATYDYCSNPATLTQGPSNWVNTTDGGFTNDEPANMMIDFCGSIENNSWYIFTAASTTETFVFSAVSGDNCSSGIQALVYEVTTDGNGCCTNLNSVSNCFNPVSQAGGTVTATPLVIGNQYYLMIDGNSGSGCNFTVANWTLTLPVELIKFDGYNYKNGNKLLWTTASEINNDYFIIQKSDDAERFTDVGIVNGHGNSNQINDYEFIDDSPSYETTYYRLKQIDFDGKSGLSKIIAINSQETLDIKIYPNPSQDNFSFDISESTNNTYTINYTNLIGSVIQEQVNITEGANTYQVNDFKTLTGGIYFVQIINENGKVIKSKKIIKIK
jgi:hypothetical protein